MTLRDVFFRILFGIFLGLALSMLLLRVVGAEAGVAYAAPRTPMGECYPYEINQQDMAGVYESQWMYLEIFPCVGAYVHWINDYGAHEAGYLADRRMYGGGYLYGGYVPDKEINAYLDGAPYMAVAPAEPGFIKITTLTEDGKVIRVYRLQKTA